MGGVWAVPAGLSLNSGSEIGDFWLIPPSWLLLVAGGMWSSVVQPRCCSTSPSSWDTHQGSLAVNLNLLQCAGISVSFRGETGGFWGVHPHCSAWFLLSPLLGRHDFKPRTIWGFILQCAALSCGNAGSCSKSRLDPMTSRVSSNQSESVIHSPVPKQTVGAELKM